MIQCVWKTLCKGSSCTKCGYALKQNYTEPPIRECKEDRQLCPHFLGATKETVKVLGCGCPSESKEGIDITVCECALETHPRCTLFERGTITDASVVRCSTCLDNPSNQRAN